MPFQSRFKFILLAYTLLTLVACGGGGNTSAPNHEGDQGDGTQLSSGSDSNVGDDSGGVDDVSEEPQDPIAPFLEQRPLTPVVITTNYHLTEDFSDISSGDGPLTEELFSQLDSKQHLNARLSPVAFGGDDAKFRSITHSLLQSEYRLVTQRYVLSQLSIGRYPYEGRLVGQPLLYTYPR